MAENSKIEWTTHTFNPWRGCTKVSEACRHCYAETLAGRNPKVLGVWGPNGTRVVAAESMWREPVKWNKAAEGAAERPRVFCASLADVFEDWSGPMVNSKGEMVTTTVPGFAERPATMQDVRVRLLKLIIATPNLDWLLLTKRPQNVSTMLRDAWSQIDSARDNDPRNARPFVMPANVWLGTTVENQAAADERIPHLLRVPAAVRFLSCEPLLEPVDLTRIRIPLEGTSFMTRSALHATDSLNKGAATPGRDQRIDWVIAGGESGGGSRPMDPAWAQSLRDQCVAAGVAFHFKQWGDYLHTHPSELHLSNGPLIQLGGVNLQRVGKKNAGRLLDGRTWDELPTVREAA